MPGSFHGINMASSALRAFQRAMETSGNNLANVNTRGYSRQRVNLESMDPASIWSGGQFQLGAGVRIESISRARELFLEARFHSANGDLSKLSTYTGGLRDIEGVYHEPGDTGISSALGKLFDSFSGLASNPTDSTARTRVRDAGQLLADRIRGSYRDLNTLRDQTMANMETTVSQINSIGSQLADLNAQIRASQATGGLPNDLMDQRDTLLRDLSQLSGVSTAQQGDGTLNVYLSNFPLVMGDSHRAYPSTFNPATQTVTDGSSTYTVRGGQLLGQMMTVNRIDQAKAELDTLANNLRSQFNALHSTGINQLGNTGVNFFNDVTPPALPTGAIDFDLDPTIKSDVRAIASGTTAAASDGGLALALSQLKDTKLAALGQKTFGQYYSASIGSVVTDIAHYDAQQETFDSVLTQIEAQADSISGVSVDDEMTDLMRFQRSYQAAAKVLTIMDQTTEDLINMLNR